MKLLSTTGFSDGLWEKIPKSRHSNNPQPPPHGPQNDIIYGCYWTYVTNSNNQAPTLTFTWLFEEVLASSFVENLQKLELRQQTCRTKGNMDGQTNGWMDGWTSINKHNGWRQKHQHELQRRWRCCKSDWRVKDKTQSDKQGIFYPVDVWTIRLV